MKVDLTSQTVLKRFDAFIKEGRLAHAYLFLGARGCGKSETALAVAKLLNCSNRGEQFYCGQCSSCLKIEKENHPDVHIFEATTKEEAEDGLIRPMPNDRFDKSENRSLRIPQIRRLITEVQMRPYESTMKIFIVKDIESLTPESANAFLKTLEEPSQQSLLLLTSSCEEKILDTVKSRCQKAPFFGLPGQKLEECLLNDYHMDKSTAHFLSFFARGSLGGAVILKEARIFEMKNEAIDQFIYSAQSEPYFKGLVADKEKTRQALEVMLTWFRDLTLLKIGIQDRTVVNCDRMKDLTVFQKKYTFDELIEGARDIVKTIQLLEDNFNPRIALTLVKEKLWRK